MLLPWVLKGNTTSTDTEGTANFSKHIDRAEGLVNGYISARYSLPFAVVPPIIRSITEDIACYYFIRSTYPQDGERKNEYADMFKVAVSQLEQIRDGKTPVCATDGSIIAQVTTGKFKSSTANYTPTFGDDDPMNWDNDPTKESDQTGAR